MEVQDVLHDSQVWQQVEQHTYPVLHVCALGHRPPAAHPSGLMLSMLAFAELHEGVPGALLQLLQLTCGQKLVTIVVLVMVQ